MRQKHQTAGREIYVKGNKVEGLKEFNIRLPISNRSQWAYELYRLFSSLTLTYMDYICFTVTFVLFKIIDNAHTTLKA